MTGTYHSILLKTFLGLAYFLALFELSHRLDPKSRYLLDIIRDHLSGYFSKSEHIVKHLRSSVCAKPPRRLRSTKLFELSFLRSILQRLSSLFLRLSPSSGPLLVISSHSVHDNIVLNSKHRTCLAKLSDMVNGAIEIIVTEKSVTEKSAVETKISGSSTGSHNDEEIVFEMDMQYNSSDECDGFTSTTSSLGEGDLFCNEEMEIDTQDLF